MAWKTRARHDPASAGREEILWPGRRVRRVHVTNQRAQGREEILWHVAILRAQRGDPMARCYPGSAERRSYGTSRSSEGNSQPLVAPGRTIGLPILFARPRY